MALDPAEQHLRHVEKDVLIPKIMREKARERCSEQVQDFTKCCKDSGILMVVKCRKENSALKECLTSYYNDPAFLRRMQIGIPERKGRIQKNWNSNQEKATEASHKYVGKCTNDT